MSSVINHFCCFPSDSQPGLKLYFYLTLQLKKHERIILMKYEMKLDNIYSLVIHQESLWSLHSMSDALELACLLILSRKTILSRK